MAEAIKVSRGGVYVPEWGNADREEADKIKVYYRFLSFAEQQELLRPEDVGQNFSYESRVIGRMVTKVENLSIDDGKERKIETGEDVINDPALDKLAMEVWLYFRNLSAVDKKKSKSASGSGSKGSTDKKSDRKSVTGGSE